MRLRPTAASMLPCQRCGPSLPFCIGARDTRPPGGAGTLPYTVPCTHITRPHIHMCVHSYTQHTPTARHTPTYTLAAHLGPGLYPNAHRCLNAKAAVPKASVKPNTRPRQAPHPFYALVAGCCPAMAPGLRLLSAPRTHAVSQSCVRQPPASPASARAPVPYTLFATAQSAQNAGRAGESATLRASQRGRAS